MEAETRIRKRIPKSCRRCHRRKQRCVGGPTCANCESANQPCSRAESALSWHHGMSKGALAHRIETLEAQLASLDGSESPSCNSPQSDNSHQSVIRFLTRGREASEEPNYLGPSSGLSITENLNQIVHCEDGLKLLPIHADDHLESEPVLQAQKAKASPPDDAVGTKILDAYFKNMHIRLPFLDPSEILDLHACRYQPVGLTPQEHFDKFKIFMVYAIGAAILQMSETYDSIPPKDYLVTALQFDATLRESLSVASIEAMLLIVLYNLRSSSNSSVWYMIGLAMRTCVDFGFHRETQYQKLKPYEATAHRRLFWSVYLIERHTAWSLGRPFSIAEEEIDTRPPSNMNDSRENPSLPSSSLSQVSEKTWETSLGRFIASIRLQRIVSQIHSRIYRVDKKLSILVPEISSLMEALQEFKQTLPSLDLGDEDFIHMHWNNAMRCLLHPFITILHPQDNLIGTCLSASGQMCQFFKKLRQRDSSGYSYLLVNSVFMAGLTMCLCLFRSPSLWSPAVSNDLRACSSALFVMAERNSRLKKHRDRLELIINRAMEFVQDTPSNSHTKDLLPVPRGSIAEQHEPFHPHLLDRGGAFDNQSFAPDISDAFGSSIFGGQMTDTFMDFPGFFADLPNESAYDIEGKQFQGNFTEDFWTANAFNLPMADGFNWRV